MIVKGTRALAALLKRDAAEWKSQVSKVVRLSNRSTTFVYCKINVFEELRHPHTSGYEMAHLNQVKTLIDLFEEIFRLKK